MIFDLMRIVFMLISIVVGNFAGATVSQYIGFGGALIGALIIGVIIYYLYSLMSGQPTSLVGAIVFGILNYISTVITAYIGSMTTLTVGILALLVQALILSALWGWVGGKAQAGVKTGLKP